MNASRIEAELRVLLDALGKAQELGQTDEANRLLARARALAPNHEAVLNVMAINALRAGNAAAARGLLERAVGRRPNLQPLWVNLAAAARALGDVVGEDAALNRALELDGRDYLALLSKAELLLHVGREAEARVIYQSALAVAPAAGQVPPSAAQRLNRAIEVLRAEAGRLGGHLEAVLAAQRATHDPAALARFDQGVLAMLGAGRVYTSQATFFQVPELPAVPFYEGADFPWLAELEAAASTLADEAAALLADAGPDFIPYIELGNGPLADRWKELNGSRVWTHYPLARNGAADEARAPRAAQLAARLPSLPLFDVPGNAPNVSYAVIAPRAGIPPHTGATNARLTVHLPLAAAEGAVRIRVGGRVATGRVGEAIVFDDTIEHELANDADQPYVFLTLDIWNPHLTAVERDLVRTLFGAYKDFAGGRAVFEGRI